MQRFFNTTGPCDPLRHYMLPPEARIPGLLPFVQQELYFVLHAARQTGKTTTMRAFAERLRGLGYAAVWATLETSQGVIDTAEAEPLWLGALATAAEDVLPPVHQPPDRTPFLGNAVGDRLRLFLRAWSATIQVPLVLLLDEADTVSGPALVSLLRQLRAGFTSRGIGKFPVSVALIGMRDLRDYLTTAKDGVPVNPGSPFNVKKASLTMRNFTEIEVASLYQQHTDATGQIFTPEAVQRAFYWTQGQPFLVNALADLCVSGSDGAPITENSVDAAKERLILSRTTHIDSLNERLKEARVARIVAPVLLGSPSFMVDLGSDDLLYCLDLGLLRQGPQVEAANPLYREVLVRSLALSKQPDLPERTWVREGKLDVPLLVDSFLLWWRQHADVLRERDTTPYREAVPQIVFMAWVQKVANGGGRIFREYALGRGRVDVLVEFGGERHLFELKRVTDKDGFEAVKEEAQTQAVDYLERLGLQEGWILIFDERQRSWASKLWREEEVVRGRRLFMRGG